MTILVSSILAATPARAQSVEVGIAGTGAVQLGDAAVACDGTMVGSIRYNSGVVQWCNGTAWANIAGSGGTALSAITAAAGANTILNGANNQIWNWALTGATADGFTFGENVASTGGAGGQSILKATNLATSTAVPLLVTNVSDSAVSFRVNDDGTDTDTTPFIIDSAGKIGVGTASPSYLISLDGDTANQTIGMERETTAATAGRDLTIVAGGAVSGGTSLNGGNLILSAGTATGTGNAMVKILASMYESGTTADRAPSEAARFFARSGGAGGGGGMGLPSNSAVMFNGYLKSGSDTYIDADSAFEIWHDRVNDILRIDGEVPGAADGAISFQNGLTVDTSGNVAVKTTTFTTGASFKVGAVDSMMIPAGTTAQEPAAVNGMIRYDATTNKLRAVQNSIWVDAIGGAGSVAIDDLTDAFTDYTTEKNFIMGRTSAAALTAGAQWNTFIGRAAGATAANSTATTDNNTAIGDNALSALTSGTANTAIGTDAMSLNTSGNYNAALGTQALNTNTTGSWNTAVGERGLFANTTGGDNTAVGQRALTGNTTGGRNIAVGGSALFSNVAKNESTAVGFNAMYYADSTVTASVTYNTALGAYALQGSATASANTGTSNTSVGHSTLKSNTTGSYNTAVGKGALQLNTTGGGNTGVGDWALHGNTTGSQNIAMGEEALRDSNSNDNVALGYTALQIATGGTNTAVGSLAGDSITTGAGNIVLGYNVDTSAAGASNELNIGNTIYGDLSTDRVAIGTATMTTGADLKVAGTGAVMISAGTTAQEPAAVNGMIRYDATTNKLRAVQNSIWVDAIGGGGSTAISGLTAAGATNTINNATYAQEWQWNTLAGATALKLSSTSTAAAANAQKMFEIALSGANGTATQTTYGAYMTNTHTGATSTNIGLYASASGGTTNYAAVFPAGNVGIGTATPVDSLHVYMSADAQNIVNIENANPAGSLGDAVLKLKTRSGEYNIISDDNTKAMKIFDQTSAAYPGTLKIQLDDTGLGLGVAPLNGLDVGTNTIRLRNGADYQTIVAGTWGTHLVTNKVAGGKLRIGENHGALGLNAGDGATNYDLVLTGGTGKGVGLAGNNASPLTGNGIYINTSNQVLIGTATATTGATLKVGSTDSMMVPAGTTAQEPAAVNGMIRYDTTTNKLRAVQNSIWVDAIGGGAGASAIDDLSDAYTIYDAGVTSNFVLGRAGAAALTAGAVQNLFIGENVATGLNNALADSNVAVGYSAMSALTSGDRNTAVGAYSLQSTTTGGNNVAYGRLSLSTNTTGDGNVGVGYGALQNNVAKRQSVAIGNFAMGNADSSATIATTYNTAVGYNAMQGSGTPASNTGTSDTAVGHGALAVMTTASDSVAIGKSALTAVTTGGTNTAVGSLAGDSITTGAGNILLGYNVDTSAAGASNELNIGNAIFGDLSTDNVRIGGSGAVGAGPLTVAPPANEAIAAAATITANACGTIKPIMVGLITTNSGDVTTGTTNTFTAPTSSYNGCCMDVVNVENAAQTDDITLDVNTNFVTSTGANITLAPQDMIRVCSNGTFWYQAEDKVAGAGGGAIDDLTDAYTDYTTEKTVIIGRTSAAALTAGAQWNTFVGRAAGATSANSTATTDNNTAIGDNALSGLTSGTANTAVGTDVLSTNTSGNYNTAVGFSALNKNTTGGSNSVLGEDSLSWNTTGSNNIAIGNNTVQDNTVGNKNVGIGQAAIGTNVAKSESTAVGYGAMGFADSSAVAAVTYNTALGAYALQGSATASANTGIKNTAIGHSTLKIITTASFNTAVGYDALASNVSGNGNVAVGSNALVTSSTGANNVAVGDDALLLATGSQNTAVGQTAGNSITTGAGNILLGFGVDTSAAGASNELNIGNTIYGDLSTDRVAIGTATMTTGADLKVAGTGAVMISAGTTAEAPAAVNGMIRYDATTNKLRAVQGGAWQDVIGAVSGGLDDLTDAYADYATSHNVIIGRTAAAALTVGAQNNTFIGEGAGATAANSTAGTDLNTAIGVNALSSLRGTVGNTAIGFNSMLNTTTGAYNLGVGAYSLRYNTTGQYNAAFGGVGALENNTTGDQNTAGGMRALFSNVANSDSVAIGFQAMQYANDTATGAITYNTAIGTNALRGSATASANTGVDNTAIGHSALTAATTAADSVAVGKNALTAVTTGGTNTAVGSQAGDSITTGTGNIVIGYNVDTAAATSNDTMNIGNTIYADLSTDRVAIGGFGSTQADLEMLGTKALLVSKGTAAQRPTAVDGMIRYKTDATIGFEVYEAGAWKAMGAAVSDIRLKKDIAELDGKAVLDRLSQVQGISYRLKAEGEQGRTHYGVIAQDLEKVFPEIVDGGGPTDEMRSVRYLEFTGLLIEATKELRTENDALKSEVSSLKAEREDIHAALDDLRTDVNGLKAHTGYGTNKASMLPMALAMLAGAVCMAGVGAVYRRRRAG